MPGPRAGAAVLIMVCAAVLAGLDAVIVRMLAGGVHPLIIGFFRALFGLLAVLPFLLRRVEIMASPYRALHVVRAGLKFASLVALFIAFGHAPLADATAINFTMPIFLTLGAWIFLKEKVALSVVFGVLAGFIGIVIIIRPGAGAFDPWLLFALAGAILTAISQLILRRMALRDTTDRLVAWNLLAMAPLGLLAALPVWAAPSPAQIGLLALQGGLGALNMALITRAFAMASASFLAPLDFLRLPVVAALAFLFFGEIAPVATWIGAAIIFGAALLAAGGARWRRHRAEGGD
ncbi:S-adenosylmethionine uptake transporter (plasmid) [Shinella sp. WSC3-e]|nr:Drug/metabolite transporter (DMT)-like permease [Rhizobiaceae bacterium]CAK7259764.1 S-adenosylmethionine uptake transporter [Shinella sp. WSC3-e]